jgi:hypothetical protein
MSLAGPSPGWERDRVRGNLDDQHQILEIDRVRDAEGGNRTRTKETLQDFKRVSMSDKKKQKETI